MGNIQKVTFNNKISRAFSSTVKERVQEYFTSNEISQHANGQMVLKTITLLSLYFGYLLKITAIFSRPTLGLTKTSRTPESNGLPLL
jgi:hypothetical protein